jgi:patatin-like phospholipase/acyl hydrolase
VKVLSLDGGGVFGRVQSEILSKTDCLDKFDMFVGTSIGSVIALAIAVGRQDRIVPGFFDERMPRIFVKSWARRVNIFKPLYGDAGLNGALGSVFDSSMLGEAKKPVFVTAVEMGSMDLKVFSSTSFDDSKWPTWEVARCAVAAETFFDPWKGFADGGIHANNPGMVAMAAAARVMRCKIEDMEVLSIGTGDRRGKSSYQPRTRIGQAIWTVRAMQNGAANGMHNYFVGSMPVKKYVRVQFVGDPKWKMDNPRDMWHASRRWAVEIEAAKGIVEAF